MSNIRVCRSFLDPEYLSKKLSNKYKFQDIAMCKPIKFGGSNDIFLLKTSNRSYVIKIFFERQCWEYNKEHYLFELELQEYLEKNNFSVPRPIKNKQGNIIDTIILPEGSKYLAVYEYVSGFKWDHTLTKDKRLKILGETVAKFHNIASKFRSGLNCSRELNLKLLLDKAWNDIEKYVELPNKKIKKELHNVYSLLSSHSAGYKLDENLKLIHGDIHAGNHLYNPDSGKITLIDFELCGYGYYMYEFAVLKWDLLNSHKKDFVDRCMNEFFEGYSKINSINKEDFDVMDFFIKVRYFFMLGSSFLFYKDKPQMNSEYILNYYIKCMKE
ncbi:phosphotransferase [Candidatus Bandiella numerosa]|uniref:phosphotransferase enzyme family protein n=1 Tax=Candidatus Bandiella numerosa TaxID=2570586 RepID=UPI00249E3571|nr:phosphotransferase [Candidatus Bandiella numerosa]WHA04420.1 phosphotransferase [Candidatus Bandiella numerosa]